MSYRKNRWRYLVMLTVMSALCLVLPLSRAQEKSAKVEPAKATTQGPAEAGKYVGEETCRGCHEDESKQIAATQHFKATAAKGRGEAWHGCESCHGPGAAHVEGGGDKSKIGSFKDVSPKEATARCMQCHESNAEHMTFNRSVHARAGVGCTSCHDIHKAKEAQFLLNEKQPALCFNCHGENKAEFMKPFRHRVTEGLVQCSDCHNVHGGTAEKQLRTSVSQDAVCFKCHTDKKGPFVFEHEPVKSEGCSACHTPHGSNNPRLLNASQMNALCLQCHTFSGGLAGAAGPHPQNTKSQACTLCHTQIHGSNTHEFFFK
jgi:DmsE family decaheme c-type cytochrome